MAKFGGNRHVFGNESKRHASSELVSQYVRDDFLFERMLATGTHFYHRICHDLGVQPEFSAYGQGFNQSDQRCGINIIGERLERMARAERAATEKALPYGGKNRNAAFDILFISARHYVERAVLSKHDAAHYRAVHVSNASRPQRFADLDCGARIG